MSTNPRARAWVGLDAAALAANHARLAEAAGAHARLIPMVKADAYGLGVDGVVSRLERLDPYAYGVAAVDEGIHLRALGVTRPVAVLAPAPPGQLADAVRHDLDLAVPSLEAAERVADAARAVGRAGRIHVEVDTGMGRSGFDWREAASWFRALRRLLGPHLAWAGCFTHLHSADEDGASARAQAARFREAVDGPDGPGTSVLRHVLNSAGVLRLPELAMDAVRPGIFLYGGSAGDDLPSPEPVASVHARVVHVRDVPEGTTCGYGATYTSRGPERWATLSIGYGDGLPRALGNRGHALLGGRRVPIIGRVSMDVTVVNIGAAGGVGVGDVATLIGRDGAEEITVDEVAALAGTISYEVLTGLTRRLPRIWSDDHGS